MVMRNRIKECRQVAGMSQKELSNLVGIKDNAISRYETGTCEPRLEMWEKLATALNVTPAYLVGWSDEPQCQVIERTQLQQRLSRNAELRKQYAGGVVITLKDGKKLYDSAKVNGIGYDATGKVIIGKIYLVPISQVAYVERIEDDEAN